MGRHASLRTLIAASASAMTLGACVSDDFLCEDVPANFALAEPNGATELIPGGSVHLAWTPTTALSAFAGFVLADGSRRVAATGNIDLRLDGVDISLDASGAPIPQGIYRIEADFGGCAETSTLYDGGPLRLVYAQGASFAEAPLTISGNQTPWDIPFITVSLSTMDVELRVDPTPERSDDGDEIAYGRTSVPGELVRMTRHVAFTGDDIDGLPIPGGTYRVIAHVTARMGTVTYDVRGPELTWTP